MSIPDSFGSKIDKKTISTWLILGMAALFIGLFIKLTFEIAFEGPNGDRELATIDQAVLQFVAKFRTPTITAAAVDLTALGSTTVLAIFSVVFAFLLWLKCDRLGSLQLLGGSMLFIPFATKSLLSDGMQGAASALAAVPTMAAGVAIKAAAMQGAKSLAAKGMAGAKFAGAPVRNWAGAKMDRLRSRMEPAMSSARKAKEQWKDLGVERKYNYATGMYEKVSDDKASTKPASRGMNKTARRAPEQERSPNYTGGSSEPKYRVDYAKGRVTRED